MPQITWYVKKLSKKKKPVVEMSANFKVQFSCLFSAANSELQFWIWMNMNYFQKELNATNVFHHIIWRVECGEK